MAPVTQWPFVLAVTPPCMSAVKAILPSRAGTSYLVVLANPNTITLKPTLCHLMV